MGYSAGMLNKRVTIARRIKAEAGKMGLDSGGIKYQEVDTVWAEKKFNKGAKSLNAGAVDAYDVVLFRMRYRSDIDRWCLLKCQGVWYQIESFNEDFTDNQIQITAREMTNQSVTIVTPPEPSSSEI
jgi:SPP1 family predicted phage head-tail adaptor